MLTREWWLRVHGVCLSWQLALQAWWRVLLWKALGRSPPDQLADSATAIQRRQRHWRALLEAALRAAAQAVTQTGADPQSGLVRPRWRFALAAQAPLEAAELKRQGAREAHWVAEILVELELAGQCLTRGASRFRACEEELRSRPLLTDESDVI